MKIENAQYVKSYQTGENCAINCIANGVHVSVHLKADNRHYAEILRQVKEEGLTIQDAD